MMEAKIYGVWCHRRALNYREGEKVKIPGNIIQPFHSQSYGATRFAHTAFY